MKCGRVDYFFFFSSRRRHTRLVRDWSSDVCSSDLIAEYGGKVLVRNPNPEVLEGSDSGVAVVIEFESIENARNFYGSSAYTEAKAVRELAADTDLILVEGM